MYRAALLLSITFLQGLAKKAHKAAKTARLSEKSTTLRDGEV